MIENTASFTFSEIAEKAVRITDSALYSLRPDQALGRVVEFSPRRGKLLLGSTLYNLALYKRIFVVGIGISATASVNYFLNLLADTPLTVAIFDPQSEASPSNDYYPATVHPTSRNQESSERLLRYGPFKSTDLVIAITDATANHIINAGSHVPSNEQQQIQTALRKLGASIEEQHTVLMHLAAGRGGDLAHLFGQATIFNFLISNALNGNHQPMVTSPFLPHGTNSHEAKAIIEKYNILAYCNLESCTFIETRVRPEPVKSLLVASPLTWLEGLKTAFTDSNISVTGSAVNFMQTPDEVTEINLLQQLNSDAAVSVYLSSGRLHEPAGFLCSSIFAGEPLPLFSNAPTFDVGASILRLS